MSETNNKIIDAVVDFLKQGEIEQISMSKIANEIGIGKSTIYEYYDSKEKLMQIAIEKLLSDYVDRILSCSMDKDAYQIFYEHIDCIMEISHECCSFSDVMRKKKLNILDSDEIKKVVNNAITTVKKRIMEIVDIIIKEKNIIPKREINMFIILGFLCGCFVNFFTEPMGKDKFINDIYENLLVLLAN